MREGKTGPIERAGEPAEPRLRAGRRGFLGAVLAAATAGAGWLLGGIRTLGRGPRELDLSEADLDGPHDLAG